MTWRHPILVFTYFKIHRLLNRSMTINYFDTFSCRKNLLLKTFTVNFTKKSVCIGYWNYNWHKTTCATYNIALFNISNPFKESWGECTARYEHRRQPRCQFLNIVQSGIRLSVHHIGPMRCWSVVWNNQSVGSFIRRGFIGYSLRYNLRRGIVGFCDTMLDRGGGITHCTGF